MRVRVTIPTPVLVLASPAVGPNHGHAMIEHITSLCGTRPGPGTLYGAISRLEQRGWIEPLPRRSVDNLAALPRMDLGSAYEADHLASVRAGGTGEAGDSINAQLGHLRILP